jgi:hypothetical protein
MFQDHSINWNLYIIINEGQRKVEENGHLIKDGEEDREGTAQCEMDESKEEN